jgi:hypothetical protein
MTSAGTQTLLPSQPGQVPSSYSRLPDSAPVEVLNALPVYEPYYGLTRFRFPALPSPTRLVLWLRILLFALILKLHLRNGTSVFWRGVESCRNTFFKIRFGGNLVFLK